MTLSEISEKRKITRGSLKRPRSPKTSPTTDFFYRFYQCIYQFLSFHTLTKPHFSQDSSRVSNMFLNKILLRQGSHQGPIWGLGTVLGTPKNNFCTRERVNIGHRNRCTVIKCIRDHVVWWWVWWWIWVWWSFHPIAYLGHALSKQRGLRTFCSCSKICSWTTARSAEVKVGWDEASTTRSGLYWMINIFSFASHSASASLFFSRLHPEQLSTNRSVPCHPRSGLHVNWAHHCSESKWFLRSPAEQELLVLLDEGASCRSLFWSSGLLKKWYCNLQL